MTAFIRTLLTSADTDQLLRYATAGQLEPLLKGGITQGKIAQGAGLGGNPRNAGPVLPRALRKADLRTACGLDEIIGALAPGPERHGRPVVAGPAADRGTGGKIGGSSLAARVPPSWTSKILIDPPGDEVGS